ncbi:MAG: hypothetical protein IPO32_16490 [Crocinitomicaceae bacterium]|nr:hypothetical protein [Crocinitomicaceae bacterium]
MGRWKCSGCLDLLQQAGLKIEEGTWANGLMNGIWKYYYPNGKIQEERSMGKFSSAWILELLQ